jgi:hypothetical protein
MGSNRPTVNWCCHASVFHVYSKYIVFLIYSNLYNNPKENLLTTSQLVVDTDSMGSSKSKYNHREGQLGGNIELMLSRAVDIKHEQQIQSRVIILSEPLSYNMIMTTIVCTITLTSNPWYVYVLCSYATSQVRFRFMVLNVIFNNI